MKKRSKQNNPEQKTKNGSKHDFEFGKEASALENVKVKNSKKSQPVKSKQHQE
ncbi:glycogen biosynthesis protein GlgD [Metabacillus sp. GX 13764]|uniref:glycogen biosynthesis protein GlgD n=1 Tax=Metabacillus kandeliae TaxID=2900151 RepID=UPI001E59600D|nr:glycogen biosynthesis protein GlgD [Metabacillus kandeliae]MCD7032666.1 glycogen biosynthesis protein GlgD [Metabacillus kandeliae]